MCVNTEVCFIKIFFFKKVCPLPNNLNLKTTTFPFINIFKILVNELNKYKGVFVCPPSFQKKWLWHPLSRNNELQKHYINPLTAVISYRKNLHQSFCT